MKSDPSADSSGGGEIFIVAGEPSGDLIGSLLISRLLKLNPALKITGIGGDQMAAAGATIRTNIVRDLAIIGLTEVITKFPQIRRLFNDTVGYLREHRPDVLVLIDYPGFNLRLAEQAHRLGIKVVYYVIPQVWAWHQSRAHKIRKFVDEALVLFPFEEKFLRKFDAKATYVGHPLMDIMNITMGREEVFERFQLDPAKKLIGLLPGSRSREVDALLPVMLKAAERIQAAMPDVQFALPRASTVSAEEIERHLGGSSVQVKVIDSFRYNVRSAMDFAIVASGTATLETGLLLRPMVIVYKIAPFTAFLARLVLKIPHAGLINIVAEKEVVPELLQGKCTPENVARESLRILNDPAEIERIKSDLRRVKEALAGAGASQRAAECVLEVYEEARRRRWRAPAAAGTPA